VQIKLKVRGAWVRPFALTAVVSSVVFTLVFLLAPTWANSSFLDGAFGLYATVDALILVIFLMFIALVFDVTVIVLTLVFAGGENKLANLTMGVIAFAVVGATILFGLLVPIWGSGVVLGF
jgi:hypothetical protein